MTLWINADDLGASNGINASIEKAAKHGALNKVSIMVNGFALEDAVRVVKEQNLSHSLHLNFCEGKPISSLSEVPLLVDGKGILSLSYASFWLRSLISKEFRKQIKAECSAQISKYVTLFPDCGEISLDSHQYYHLIPQVLNQLIELKNEGMPIGSVRVVNEPFLFIRSELLYSLKNIFSSNIIKLLLLRTFTFFSLRKLKRTGISFNRYFCGVLYSGNMKSSVFEKFKKKLNFSGETDSFSEILFHPGHALPQEKDYWQNQKELIEFYFSSDRNRESAELINIKNMFL